MSDRYVSPAQLRRIAVAESAPAFDAEAEERAAATRQAKRLASVAARRGLDSSGATLGAKTGRKRR